MEEEEDEDEEEDDEEEEVVEEEEVEIFAPRSEEEEDEVAGCSAWLLPRFFPRECLRGFVRAVVKGEYCASAPCSSWKRWREGARHEA